MREQDAGQRQEDLLQKEDLLRAASEQIKALRHERPIPLEITAEVAMVVISQLQLALRHPENVGPSRALALSVIEGLRGRIARPGDPLDRLILMGFEERFDQ